MWAAAQLLHLGKSKLCNYNSTVCIFAVFTKCVLNEIETLNKFKLSWSWHAFILYNIVSQRVYTKNVVELNITIGIV